MTSAPTPTPKSIPTPVRVPDLLTRFIRIPSPLGRIEIVADAGEHPAIVGVTLESAGALPLDDLDDRPDELLLEAADQIGAYFLGQVPVPIGTTGPPAPPPPFTVPVRAEGTAFQRAVWAQLTRVPFGSATTFGDLAAAAGVPAAGRAVGCAVRRNPLALLVPCHRVLASGGRFAAYSGVDRSGGNGRPTKAWLLEHEGIDHHP